MPSVLIVEDDDEIQQSLEGVLEWSYVSCVTQTNGRLALEWLRACEDEDLPNLILLDLMMPEMDGYQFRALQLKDPRIADIPTVIVSAQGRGEEDRAMMGCRAYLAKPYELEALMREVFSVQAVERAAMKTKNERRKTL